MSLITPSGVQPQVALLRSLGAFQVKEGAKATAVHALKGRLYVSQTGWGLLSVPNAMVRGAFDALNEPGIELPMKDGQLDAHISVFRKEEIEEIGGKDKITERGHTFSYSLGPVKTTDPAGWPEFSRVWFIEVRSPDLMKLRKTYGLGKPKYPFHITIAVARKGVLYDNEVSKAAFFLKAAAAPGDMPTTGLAGKALKALGTVTRPLIGPDAPPLSTRVNPLLDRLNAFGMKMTAKGLNPNAMPHSQYQGTAAPAVYKLQDFFRQRPSEARELTWEMHKHHPSSPRGALRAASVQQGYKPSLYSPEGMRLLAARTRTQPPKHVSVSGQKPGMAGSISYSPIDSEVVLPKSVNEGEWPGIYNHEVLEHGSHNTAATVNALRQQEQHLDDDFFKTWYASTELPAVMGDLVFKGEQAGQAIGRPLDHTVTFPGGHESKLPWMIEQAKKHGYFEGRTMADLLATPEGLQYLQTIMRKLPDRALIPDTAAEVVEKESSADHKEGPSLDPFPVEKQAVPARVMGIPDRTDYGDLSKLPVGKLLDLYIQKHMASRAGEHFDIRLGSPDLGLYSWATRKELPEPKGKTGLFQQPLHAYPYGEYQGPISRGYGAGHVRQHSKGKVMVTSITPQEISFTTATEKYPQRFKMIKMTGGKSWLLINTTPTEATPYNKVHYRVVPSNKVDSYLQQMKAGDSIQAKVDGAASLVKLLKDNVEVMSYRTSKTTGRPIVHTERMFQGKRPKLDIPPELVGTVLKGEIYGERTGPTGESTSTTVPSILRRPDDPGADAASGTEALAMQATESNGSKATAIGDHGRRSISPQELGGILNATLANSIEQQKAKGIQLKDMLYDIQQLGDQPIDPDEVPYAERRRMLSQVLPTLPQEQFHLSEEATDPESARAMWSAIREGRHPLTEEGIVIHPATGRPMKSKLLEEQDVHIKGIFPGAGKYLGTGAGGFTYAMEPGGAEVGKVGTGLSDDLRRSLLQDPAAYIGRIARVRSQGAFPSGALRAPALLALHEG